MKELKLLQIIPSLNSGGVETGTVDLANYIAKDLGVLNYIASSGGEMMTMLDRKKIQHIKLPIHSKNPFIMYNNIGKLKEIIKKHNINLVHVRSRAPAWTTYYACRKICKTISTFHNVYNYDNLIKKFYNSGLTKMNRIVAISNFVESSLINNYKVNKKKIKVIHRGIDTDFFNPDLNNENDFMKFYNRFNLPNNKKIILYPGRLTSWKGQVEFLDILKNLVDYNIVCYFVGDTKNFSYTKKLEKEINRKNLNQFCKIFGSLSRQDLRNMYKCADVVISSPLKPEGFGRIISEALSMKKIILSYNYGGAKEQISEINQLLSVKPLDKKDMLNKIITVLKMDDEEKKVIGETSRKFIISKFSKQNMLKRYVKLYEEMIKN